MTALNLEYSSKILKKSHSAYGNRHMRVILRLMGKQIDLQCCIVYKFSVKQSSVTLFFAPAIFF